MFDTFLLVVETWKWTIKDVEFDGDQQLTMRGTTLMLPRHPLEEAAEGGTTLIHSWIQHHHKDNHAQRAIEYNEMAVLVEHHREETAVAPHREETEEEMVDVPFAITKRRTKRELT